MTSKPLYVRRLLAVCLTTLLMDSAYSKYDLSSEAPISSPYELLDFQSEMSRMSESQKEDLVGKNMKLKAMYDLSKNIAIRAAMRSQLQSFEKDINQYSRQLDAIYNFSPLMIQGRVVPPVIAEAHNLYNQPNANQIRLSKAIYSIEKQAYFSSTAPNWRNYLKFSNEASAFEKYTYSGGYMEPKSQKEKEVWEKGTIEGWRLGIEQANVVLSQSFDRLNTDYIGMIRFHRFVIEGKINMPVINQYNLYDTNSGDKMVLDEQLLKIQVLPSFSSNKLSIERGNVTQYTTNNASRNLMDLIKDSIRSETIITKPAVIKVDENLKFPVDKLEIIQNEKVEPRAWEKTSYDRSRLHPANPPTDLEVKPVQNSPRKVESQTSSPDKVNQSNQDVSSIYNNTSSKSYAEVYGRNGK